MVRLRNSTGLHQRKKNHSGLSKIGNSLSRRETPTITTSKLKRLCSRRENQLESHLRVLLIKPPPLKLLPKRPSQLMLPLKTNETNEEIIKRIR